MLADLAEEREPAAAEIRNSLLDTMAQGDRALLWQAEHASSLGEAIRALETLGLAPFTPRVMPARVSP
jgi:hypothetical protein